MKVTVAVTTTYNCSLERAFKTPMLCDVARVHTGYGVMPKITHVSDDDDWGQPGGSKWVYASKSLSFGGGKVSLDKVLERVENEYWKIEVSDFQSWMLGFYKFVGEWKTTELEPNRIRVDYTYTLYAKGWLLYPLNWLFAKTFWRTYMKHVLENIRTMIREEEPYIYR